MDEGAPDVRPITLGQISSRDSALGSSDLDDFSTIADDLGSSPSLKDEPSPFQPLGHASNMSTSTSLINSSSPLPFTLFNNPFYESARARYGDDPNDPSPFDPSRELPPITPYTTTTSSTSSGGTPRRKSSKFSSLMFKLFHSPLLLIEAASDGDAAKVSKLLALGADVNAVDKWKWTAMSMAAYGGHAEVAKILIAAGARLDMKDVDGETPLDLATKGGHRELVMLIDEEETRRGLVGVSEA
jgi:Ankyrin repeats (many copies)